jgi:hypothetical protein
MIVMDEKIVGVWFVVTILDCQDWLAAISEIEPDVKYKMTYRFRYYKDDLQPFESKDRKSWYEGEITGTRTYCILSVRKVAEMLHGASKAGEPLYEVLNNNGIDQFTRDFQDLPFVFGRFENKIPASA